MIFRCARRLRLPLAWLVLSFAGCGGGLPAAFPGRADVGQAEVGWCDMIVKTKLVGPDAADACKAAIPASSAACLKGMTKCFKQRLDSYGENAPDKGIITAECKEETQINLPAD